MPIPRLSTHAERSLINLIIGDGFMPFQRKLMWTAAALTVTLFPVDMPGTAAAKPKSASSAVATNGVYRIYVKGIT